MKPDFSNDSLLVQMFDGPHLEATLPVVSIDMDRIVQQIDDAPTHSWAGGEIVRQVAQADFLKDVLGDVPAAEPAVLPTKPGLIPSSRSDTGTTTRSPKSATRRKKLKEMLTDSGIQITNYTQETIEHLLDSMESYVETAVRIETA
jgi:hypothetical protein